MIHYFDYAATSAVRPPEVGQAMADFLSGNGSSPGRGGYARSVESGRLCFRCRRKVAGLLGVPGDPGRLAFTMNATHALNTALSGVLDRGDAVVVTPYDHNAVLRPVHELAQSRGVRVRMMEGDADGCLDLEAARELVDGARLVVVNAVSNVLGTRLPLEALVALAHDAGALVLVDAAQSAGHLTDRPARSGADLVAFTGHKGLLGPQGTGGLWVREGIELRPLVSGGTGGSSEHREMPTTMPDRLEAGTPNAPGIAGLLAGLTFLEETGLDELHGREASLKARLRQGLEATRGVRVLSPPDPTGAGVVTILADELDPGGLALRLDREFGVMTRPGLHCAPEVHRLLGTAGTGALRFSLGWASTEESVDHALAAVDRILQECRTTVPGSERPASAPGAA